MTCEVLRSCGEAPPPCPARGPGKTLADQARPSALPTFCRHARECRLAGRAKEAYCTSGRRRALLLARTQERRRLADGRDRGWLCACTPRHPVSSLSWDPRCLGPRASSPGWPCTACRARPARRGRRSRPRPGSPATGRAGPWCGCAITPPRRGRWRCWPTAGGGRSPGTPATWSRSGTAGGRPPSRCRTPGAPPTASSSTTARGIRPGGSTA